MFLIHLSRRRVLERSMPHTYICSPCLSSEAPLQDLELYQTHRHDMLRPSLTDSFSLKFWGTADTRLPLGRLRLDLCVPKSAAEFASGKRMWLLWYSVGDLSI